MIGGIKQVDLATNEGWRETKEYVDKRLPPEKYPELNHFCIYGWSQQVSEFLQELQSLPTITLPTVGRVLSGLRETLEFNQDANSIFITDGIGPEN